MITLDDICNLALAEIAAGPIMAVTDNSIEAREVSRFAAPLLAEVGTWSDWSFAIARAVLIATANDRPAEWVQAYRTPANCVRPLAIRAQQDDATCLPPGGPFPFPIQEATPLAFVHESGLIYTNVANASLVFAAVLTDPSALPPLLLRAFALELAARVAIPIRKDTALARGLTQAAEIARARAIADDDNQRVRRPSRYTSEVAFARAGIGAGL